MLFPEVARRKGKNSVRVGMLCPCRGPSGAGLGRGLVEKTHLEH